MSEPAREYTILEGQLRGTIRRGGIRAVYEERRRDTERLLREARTALAECMAAMPSRDRDEAAWDEWDDWHGSIEDHIECLVHDLATEERAVESIDADEMRESYDAPDMDSERRREALELGPDLPGGWST